jgi:hypothetical protein
MSQQEQTSAALEAKALAAIDGAASVRLTLMQGRGLVKVKDVQAYRDELRRIVADLTQAAIDADNKATAYAELHSLPQ